MLLIGLHALKRVRELPALILGIACCLGTPAALADTTRPFTLPDTEVVDLPTAENGIDYQLYVHVPTDCKRSSDGCPVVYMLDAEYSFALAANIVSHLSARDRIPALISVAVGYRDKTKYRLNRTRDYTPFFFPEGGYGAEVQKVSGGGQLFLKFLRHEVVPHVERHYPASAHSRTLVGHSYGGLFAVYTWIDNPDLFDNYIIVSPSLWYAGGEPLKAVAKACSGRHFDGRKEIYLAVGDQEEQPQVGRAMVGDLRQLKKQLDHCESRNVATTIRIFEDETHASIFPAALSSGLRAIHQ